MRPGSLGLWTLGSGVPSRSGEPNPGASSYSGCMNGPIISTDRLLLRPWKPEDRAPFAAMNADAAVMEHFNAPLTREESDHFADFIEDRLTDHGYGLWATERLDNGEFIGFVGLAPVPFEAHFTPAVEVGWRLARPQWGFGFASEGGAAAIEFGPARGGPRRDRLFCSACQQALDCGDGAYRDDPRSRRRLRSPVVRRRSPAVPPRAVPNPRLAQAEKLASRTGSVDLADHVGDRRPSHPDVGFVAGDVDASRPSDRSSLGCHIGGVGAAAP